MADFTISGIIDVDASRATKGIKKFKEELRSLLGDLQGVNDEINRLDGREIDLKVAMQDTKAFDEVKEKIEELDHDQINIEVASDAAAEAQKILDEMQAIDDTDVNVNVDADTHKAVDEVAQFMAELDAIGDATIDVDINGGDEALVKAMKLNAEIDAEFSRDAKKEIKVKVKSEGFDKLKGDLSSMTESIGGVAGGGLVGAIVGLVSMLGPLAAAAAVPIAGMIGGFSVLATSIGAVGIFAIPTIKGIAGAFKLMQKANTPGTSATALAAVNKQLAALKKSDPELYKAAKAIYGLKAPFMDVANAIRPDVLKIFYNLLTGAKVLMKDLAPIAITAAGALAQISKSVPTFLNSKPIKGFFKYVNDNSASFLKGFIRTMGMFVKGWAELIPALDPLTKMFGHGVESMAKSWLKWTSGLKHDKSFQDFINYALQMGPKVWQTLKDLALMAINLMRNLAPLGSALIGIIDKIAKWYNKISKNNPQMAMFVTLFAAAALAIAPIAGALSGMLGPLADIGGLLGGGLIDGLSSFVGVLTGAGGEEGLIAALGAVGGPVGLLVAALVGIGIALAFTNTKTKAFAGMMSSIGHLMSTVKDVAIQVWDNFKKLWTLFKDSGAIEQFQKAFGHLADAISNLLPILIPLATIIGGAIVTALILFAYYLNAVSKAIDLFSKFVGGNISVAVKLFQKLFDKVTKVMPGVVKTVVDWLKKLPGKTAEILGDMVLRAVNKFNEIKAKASNIFENIKDAITNKIDAAKTAAVNKFDSMKTSVINAISALKDRVISFFGNIRDSLVNQAENIRSGVLNKIDALVSGFKTKLQNLVSSAASIAGNVKGKITGAFSGAASWLWNAGVEIIQGLINGITSKIHDLVSTLGSVTKLIPHIKGPIEKDKVLLTPAGKAIMDGLVVGILSKKSNLVKELSGITNTIGNMKTPSINSLNSQAMSSSLVNGDLMPGDGMGSGNNYYNIEVKVPLGATAAQTGREIVKYITAYESAGGRTQTPKVAGGSTR